LPVIQEEDESHDTESTASDVAVTKIESESESDHETEQEIESNSGDSSDDLLE